MNFILLTIYEKNSQLSLVCTLIPESISVYFADENWTQLDSNRSNDENSQVHQKLTPWRNYSRDTANTCHKA